MVMAEADQEGILAALAAYALVALIGGDFPVRYSRSGLEWLRGCRWASTYLGLAVGLPRLPRIRGTPLGFAQTSGLFFQAQKGLCACGGFALLVLGSAAPFRYWLD